MILHIDVGDQQLADASLPLYAQVRDALRRRILSGDFTPHTRIPSESQLTAIFAVSRITIRQALAELENDGLIFRVHGKGTFVSKPKAFQDLTRLQSFGEAMHPQGHETYSRVIGIEAVKPTSHVRQQLQLEEGKTVVEIKRIRFLDHEPIAVETSHLRHDIGNELAKRDLATRDIFLILENDLGLMLGNAELLVGTHAATDWQADHLMVERGFPMLHIERLTMTTTGEPVIFEHLYHRGDAFRYKVSIERRPGRKADGAQ